MSIIKISTLKSVLHDTEAFNNRSLNFIQSIENKINNKLILSSLEEYDCDLKLIFVESGGSEMLFSNNIDKLQEPYYFLTSGEDNSLAASLEILTYLNVHGLKGEVIHGSIDYISQRILELSTKKRIELLENKRYGVIGVPSDWLISSIPNYKDIKDKFGIELIDISLDEIIKEFYKIDVDGEIDNLGFDVEEIKKALKVNKLLENIVEKYNLDGYTLRCFDLLDTIKTTGCLGLAKLNSKGIISTCEGDIMAMISMAIIKGLTNQSSFQANPSRIDTVNNTVLFAHCTLPLDMTKSYKYMTHFESGIGVAIKGELKEEEVTIFRLSSDSKHYFVSKGKIISNYHENNLCRTQILVYLDEDVKELLVNPCGNHHIICYGDHVDEINKLLK